MNKELPNSEDSQMEFLLNLHRDMMRQMEKENPEGYKADLLYQSSKELLMEHDPETENQMEKSEQKRSQYEVYLPAMQKDEGLNETQD